MKELKTLTLGDEKFDSFPDAEVRERVTALEAGAKVHVIDAGTEDVSTVDFGQFAVGDVVLVTTSG